MKRTFLSFLVMSVGLLLLGREAGATNYGPITVQEIPMTEATERTLHGYVEYRFRVTNRDSKTHQVTLEMPKTSHGSYGVLLARTANAVEVPPESTVVMRVLQPPLRLNGNADARVAINGRYQRDATTFKKVNYHMEGIHSMQQQANVLVGIAVPAEIRDYFKSGVPKEEENRLETEIEAEAAAVTPPVMHHPYGGGTTPDPEVIALRAQVPLAEWSDHWLGYSRFDAVVLTSGEWRELREQHVGIYTAIRQYVEAGGMLCVIGSDWTPPKEWVKNSERNYRALLGEVFVMQGTVEAAKPDIAPFRETVLSRAKRWTSAIGELRTYYGGGGGSTIMSGETSLLNSMPVVANYGVNVKLIMVLIVVFAVLIGPVNIYVLSMIKRRIWLLWTVPATSLVASLLVLGVSFFQEGLLRQSSSMTYTILDQRREEAITFGFVGFYSTLTPRGITFSPDTEATSCMDRSSGNSKSLEMHMLAGGNQFFTRGWISARVPSYFAVRKVLSQQKLRVAFDWSGDTPTATNGLGTDIRMLRVRSPQGDLYTVHNMKAGDKVNLVKAAEENEKPSLSESMNNLRTNYENILFNGPNHSLLRGADVLPTGSYLAEIDVWNPFLEEGIERMKPYQTSTTILGIFE